MVVVAGPERNRLLVEGEGLVGPPPPAPQVSLGDEAGGVVGPVFVDDRRFELRRRA